MNIDEYYLNEAYKHEEREKEDVYKVYLLFSLGGKKWIDSDESYVNLTNRYYSLTGLEIGWVWNTDFNQYNPQRMNYLMNKL